MIGLFSKNVRLLSVFLFCDDRRKSEKGNNFSFKKQRSIHSLSRTLFKRTDFVEISGCFCFWCRAQIGRALRKEREREKIEFHLNFIHFAPTR